MKRSIVLPARLGASSHEELLRIAELADADPGWDHLWVPDSVTALPFYDANVLLAAVAARTRRVRLGIACQASLGLRHPLLVDQQWANLDVLSGGRVTLIACPGNATGEHVERELAAFGIDYATKVARMEEHVERLRRVSASGEGERARPAFVQRPLPIWIAANPSATAGPKTLRRVLGRVARLGDGWMTYNVTPSLLRERLTLLRELSGGALPDGFPVAVFLNANVHPDEQRAYADAAARWARQSTRGISTEELRRTGAIGSPERVRAVLDELQEAGATHVAFELLSERPYEQAELLSEHVLRG